MNSPTAAFPGKFRLSSRWFPMSSSSFPRAEHITALLHQIKARIRESGQTIEVAERGLNHYKCHYKFALRRPDLEWTELSIHFQFAVRLEQGGDDATLNRVIDRFLKRHFGE